jgi:hypothetical protein
VAVRMILIFTMLLHIVCEFYECCVYLVKITALLEVWWMFVHGG